MCAHHRMCSSVGMRWIADRPGWSFQEKCVCASTMPGISVMPAQSTTIAPAPEVERRLRPTRAMRLPCTSTSPAYGCAPVASKTRAFVNRTFAIASPPCLPHRILQHTDAVDLDAYAIAALQKFRRREADAHAAGRSRRDDVARHERNPGRDRFDQRGDAEDEIASMRVLPQLLVHPAADARVRAVELVGGDQPRPHRAERVDRLAEQPLLVAALNVARRDVVEDRVAENVLHRARGADAAAALTDHDRELRLVVRSEEHTSELQSRLH